MDGIVSSTKNGDKMASLKFSSAVVFMLCINAISLTPTAVSASQSCRHVDTSLTADRKREYSRLAASVVGQGIRPSQIEISNFMQSERWSAVYVTTPVTEDGVMFFERTGNHPRFKDVYGGLADDRSEVVEWAIELGAPRDLANCFADLMDSE